MPDLYKNVEKDDIEAVKSDLSHYKTNYSKYLNEFKNNSYLQRFIIMFHGDKLPKPDEIVNSKDVNGKSLIALAKSPEMIELLVSEGAELRDSSAVKLLLSEIGQKEPDKNIVKKLLDLGAAPYSSIMYTIKEKDLSKLNILIDAGAKIEEADYKYLNSAISINNKDIISRLLDEGIKPEYNKIQENFYDIMKVDLPVIKLLLYAGLEIKESYFDRHSHINYASSDDKKNHRRLFKVKAGEYLKGNYTRSEAYSMRNVDFSKYSKEELLEISKQDISDEAIAKMVDKKIASIKDIIDEVKEVVKHKKNTANLVDKTAKNIAEQFNTERDILDQNGNSTGKKFPALDKDAFAHIISYLSEADLDQINILRQNEFALDKSSKNHNNRNSYLNAQSKFVSRKNVDSSRS